MRSKPLDTAWWALRLGFFLAPLIAGLDARARSHSVQFWLTSHRPLVLAGVAALAAGVVAGFFRRKPRLDAGEQDRYPRTRHAA